MHALALVFIKEEERNYVESAVLDRLGKYSENLDVDPWEDICDCVGEKAGDEAEEITCKKYGSWDQMRKNYDELKVKPEWGKLCEERETHQRELFNKHPDKELPDSKCKDCKGTGKVKSTRNQEGYWDWYVIGGRWDCYFTEKSSSKSQYENNIEDNVIPVSRIPFSDLPHTIVTTDGEWFECEKWHRKEKRYIKDEDWPRTCRSLYSKYRNCLAVTVDYHS